VDCRTVTCLWFSSSPKIHNWSCTIVGGSTAVNDLWIDEILQSRLITRLEITCSLIVPSGFAINPYPGSDACVSNGHNLIWSFGGSTIVVDVWFNEIWWSRLIAGLEITCSLILPSRSAINPYPWFYACISNGPSFFYGDFDHDHIYELWFPFWASCASTLLTSMQICPTHMKTSQPHDNITIS
jgi:hypothetical protein